MQVFYVFHVFVLVDLLFLSYVLVLVVLLSGIFVAFLDGVLLPCACVSGFCCYAPLRYAWFSKGIFLSVVFIGCFRFFV